MSKRIFTSGLSLLVLASTALAQTSDFDAPNRYVQFPIDQHYEKILQNRLEMEKKLGPLKDLIKHITGNPTKMPIDLRAVQGLKLDDPQIQKAIHQWATSDPALKGALEKWLQQQESAKETQGGKQFQKNLESILAKTPKSTAATEQAAPKPPVTVPDSSKPKENVLAKAAVRAMQNAEDTEIGDWLKNSPAWRRAFQELQSSMKNPRLARKNWFDLAEKLHLPEEKMWNFGEKAFERLRALPPPNVERWTGKMHLPEFGLRAPEVSLPPIPRVATPSLPTLGASVTWILLAILFSLVSWRLLRWTTHATLAQDIRAQLGPWPVRPEDVATWQDLIRAFDYVAMLTLGLHVRSWNHQAIAERWRQQLPGHAADASILTSLYERARYNESPGDLPPAARDQARRAVRELAAAR